MNGIFLRTMLLGVLLVLGCDRAPELPAKLTEPATQPAEVVPTTQELIGGQYYTLPLPGMPLSAKVPRSWKIDVAQPVTFLVGPTPSGVATIKLSSSDNIVFKPEQIDVLVNDARAQQAKQPELYRKVELQELGRVKLFERIWFEPARTAPQVDSKGNGILDSQGNLLMQTYTPVHWVLTVFVPGDSGFVRHELNFMDLTAEQYEADRVLLEKVIRNVTFEPSLAPTTGPTQ